MPHANTRADLGAERRRHELEQLGALIRLPDVMRLVKVLPQANAHPSWKALTRHHLIELGHRICKVVALRVEVGQVGDDRPCAARRWNGQQAVVHACAHAR